MQDLKICETSGKVLLKRSLTDEKGPLLILRSDGGVTLAEAAADGAQVIAALVREGNDWTLASADPAVPVVCGGKSAGSLPLVPGSACMAGGFVFRIETDAVATGNVLLWRVGKSQIAAESVLSGRNVVAADALRDGALTVNPAVPGEVSFEFYPTLDGLDVVMPDGGRTNFPRRFCFAVGTFRGLLLTAAEATAALKEGDPFAYPSRGVRRRLLAALLAIGVVALGAAYLSHEADKLELRLASEPRGAIREERPAVADQQVYFGDDYVYMLAFYRSLPLVLGAKPSPVAEDLVKRAANYKDNAEVQRTAAFLQDVMAIQKAVLDQRWDELGACLAKVDAEMFAKSDARRFLDDAREILVGVEVHLPAAILKYCTATAAEREKTSAQFSQLMEGMRDNVFLKSEAMSAWVRHLQNDRRIFATFVSTRDAVLAEKKVSAASVQRLYQALVDAEPILTDEYPDALRKAVREPVAAYAERELTSLFARFKSAKDYNAEIAAIGPLCNLAEVARVPAERLSDWRKRAQEIARIVELHRRDCYQRYRLTAADDPVAARKILDELISADDPSNRFHAWAVREKSRLDGKETK